jgi:hypothetical protein
MEHSPPLEADSRSAGKEINALEVHYYVHKTLSWRVALCYIS